MSEQGSAYFPERLYIKPFTNKTSWYLSWMLNRALFLKMIQKMLEIQFITSYLQIEFYELVIVQKKSALKNRKNAKRIKIVALSIVSLKFGKNICKFLCSLLLINLFAIALVGCGKDDDDTVPQSNGISEALVKDLQGSWERQGYGEIVVVNQSDITVKEFTRESCLVTASGSIDEFAEILRTIVVSENKSSFAIVTPGMHPDLTITFNKLMNLPDICGNNNMLQATKIDTFKHLWHNFNDYYAFFAERNIDWQQEYTSFLGQVSENMTDSEFFQLLSNVLEPLNDGHVELSSPDQIYSPKKSTLITLMEQEFSTQSEFTDLGAYINAQFEIFNNTLFSYLDGKKISHAGGPAANAVQWGSIANRVTYVYIAQLVGFGNVADAPLASQLKDLNAILDRIISESVDKEAIIFDLRFNPGGSDTLALAIANRFFSSKTLLFSKAPRSYVGLMGEREVFSQENSYKKFTQPIYILTSPDTASAAEVFCLAMVPYTNTTFVGGNTAGAFSDKLEKQLPNGWSVSLSNEVYFDINGKNHEVLGFAPDHAVEYFPLTDRQNGIDSMLDKALQLAGVIK